MLYVLKFALIGIGVEKLMRFPLFWIENISKYLKDKKSIIFRNHKTTVNHCVKQNCKPVMLTIENPSVNFNENHRT